MLDLTGYERNDLGGVSQTFATTQGEGYTVSFLLGTGGSLPSLNASQTVGPVSVLAQVFGGGAYAYITERAFQSSAGSFAVADWTAQSFTFIANGASATLSIQGLSRGPSNSVFIGLDAVSVDGTIGAVPEPGSLALTASGLVAIGGLLRRRRA